MTFIPDRGTLIPNEVAFRIGVSRALLGMMVRRGVFPQPIRPDHKSAYWTRETVEEWLKGRVTAAEAKALLAPEPLPEPPPAPPPAAPPPPAPPPNPNRLLTIKQVCDHLGVSRTTLHSAIKRGELLTTRVGSRMIRITAREIERYIDRLTQPARRRSTAS